MNTLENIDPNSSTSSITIKEVQSVEKNYSFGEVKTEPFDSRWLADYPSVLDHVLTEHFLHVKGLDENSLGLTWHATKFDATAHNPLLSPEAHFQMKIGYFLIPEEHLKVHSTFQGIELSTAEQLFVTIEGRRYTRFIVHPDAYEHYSCLLKDTHILKEKEAITTSSLGKKSLLFVPAENSTIIGTPTSSYRSWVVRDMEQQKAPFIAKVGVPCHVLGSDRWLSEAEIERSVNCQMALDSMPQSPNWQQEGSRFMVFPESLGMTITHPDYRYATVEKHSGVIIREFPKEILEGKLKVASCAALMSVEGAKSGKIPWICDLIEGAIKRSECKDAKEYLKKHFIENYLRAVEPIILAEGLTLEPHSQNLCILLTNREPTKIVGFAYRDHGGIWVDLASRVIRNQRVDFFSCNMMRDVFTPKGPATAKALVKSQGAIDRAYIQSYAWFYRYQVFIKLLNTVITPKAKEDNWIPSGAPHQIGLEEAIPERLLAPYWKKHTMTHLQKNRSLSSHYVKQASTVEQVAKEQYFHLIPQSEAEEILKELDIHYVRHINRYFITEQLAEKLPLPAVEGGAGKEKEQAVLDCHKFFGSWQISPHKMFDSVKINTTIELFWDRIDLDIDEAITFNAQPLRKEEATHYQDLPSGFLLFNGSKQLIAVIPKTKIFNKG